MAKPFWAKRLKQNDFGFNNFDANYFDFYLLRQDDLETRRLIKKDEG